MDPQTDFHLTIDRAAGLVLDATCSVRAAAARPLPAPHRRLVSRAAAKLESAQQDLFTARNDPWQHRSPKTHRQLELL